MREETVGNERRMRDETVGNEKSLSSEASEPTTTKMESAEGVTHILFPGLGMRDAYSQTELEAECHYPAVSPSEGKSPLLLNGISPFKKQAFKINSFTFISLLDSNLYKYIIN